MKIERITITHHEIQLDPPFHAAWDSQVREKFGATIVRVITDEGLVGIGSGDYMAGFKKYEDLFIGEDPLNMERHYQIIDNISFHEGRCWPLDIALWDLFGKIEKKPVYKLLGNDIVLTKAYASLGTLGSREDIVQKALGLKELGFKAMKIRFGSPNIEEDLKVVEAVRIKMGDKMDIMVDCNQGWRMPWDTRSHWELGKASKVAKALKEFNVYWIEEPLHRGDYSGMSALRAMTGCTVAGGEMTREPYEFEQLIERDCLDVLQPDAVLTCGITGLKAIAQLTKSEGLIFSPHTWGNGIGLLANLHLVAGTVGTPYIEFPYDPPQWTPEKRDFMLKEPLMVNSKGELVLSDAPGLGFELDEDCLTATLVDSIK